MGQVYVWNSNYFVPTIRYYIILRLRDRYQSCFVIGKNPYGNVTIDAQEGTSHVVIVTRENKYLQKLILI